MIGFTCGLMKDPTPLVNHIYETYVDMLCNEISLGSLQRNIETRRRLRAQGKDIGDANLLDVLYTESRVPLSGYAQHNQFICIYENHKGEIDTPSKLYAFLEMSEDDVPVTKLDEQDGSQEAPDCMMWIERPDAAAIRSLLATCNKISQRQPVTHLLMADVTCQDLTSAEAPALSRNFQAMCILNCDLPTSFWKKILHQLIGNVNLQSLWFTNTNLHGLEEDLDELFKSLHSNRELTDNQVEVVLRENNFSKKFVNKWNQTSSGISCKFDDNSFQVSDFSEDEDDSTLHEINLSWENITADLLTGLEMCEPVGRLILRNCSIADSEVFETFLKLSTSNFVTVLDLSGTNLGCNVIHISYIVAQGSLEQLHLAHCEIPPMALDLILPLLSCCKELTHLNLCGNNIEACGHHIAEFIMALGNKPALKELNLGHCSMTKETCMELLLALGNCKSLTRLNMTANSIQGCLNWFLLHPHEGLHSLQELSIRQTGLNRDDLLHLAELLENKLTCLSQLDLGNNFLHRIEDALVNLVQSCVTNHQRKLHLKLGFNNLSQVFMKTITSLCHNTSTELDIELKEPAENYQEHVEIKTDGIEHSVHHTNSSYSKELSFLNGDVHLLEESLSVDLVDAIEMSERPFPNQLILHDCIISEENAFEALMLLPIYKFLSIVDFSGTNLGYYARHMEWILFTCDLKKICLSDCQIPPPVCGHLFSAMPKCTNITHLDMARNKIHWYGHDLAETILAWGARPPLKKLDLSNCLMPPEASKYLLLALGSCRQLSNLWLPGNTLTGCLPFFIPDPHDGLHSLEELFLNYTGLNNQDLLHLIYLVKRRKLSRLKELDLGANSLYRMVGELEDLIEACITNYQNELKLYFWFNNLSIAAVDKCKFLCKNTNIELCIEPEDAFPARNTDRKAETKTQMDSTKPTGYAWREDEYLHGFYDDVDLDEVDEEEEEVSDA